MDDKLECKRMDSTAPKSKLVGMSMLLLSLLLIASVGSLIYLAVTNSHQACTDNSKTPSEIDVTASVTVKSDGKEVNEKVEYSHGGQIAYFYGSNGEFDVDDFGKGIHITKSSHDGICYLIPTGTNQSSSAGVENFLDDWDGKEITASPNNMRAKILGGKLTDTSFLPEKVHDECTNGFKWMSIVDGTVEDGELSRDKRSCYYLYVYYYCTSLQLYICVDVYLVC